MPAPIGQHNAVIAKVRNPWLDVCRSLAIVMVLLSHGRHFLIPAWGDAAAFRIGGFLGVELFFVLSGFLIGGIAEQRFSRTAAGQAWVGRFLLRRWLRTLPVYYLFLAINAALIAAAILPGRLSSLAPFAIFAQNLAWSGPPVFGEAWSLAVEEIFYLIFPLGLYFFGRVNADRRRVFLTVTLLLLLVPLLARIGVVTMAAPSWDDGVRKVVVFRLDALMTGVLTGWLAHEYRLLERFRASVLALLAIGVLAAAIAIFFTYESTLNASHFGRVWLFPLVSFGCALTILAGLRETALPSYFTSTTKVVARLSYALYLAHMPVFHFVMHFLGNAPSGDISGALIRWMIFLIGSICAAALVEHLVERPILAWRDRVLPG